MTQEENEKLMYSSPEDQVFYLKCVQGLPTLAGLDGSGNGSDGIPLPYGCGSHSVRCFREVIEKLNPRHIFEIGFNMGYSATLWLELSPKLFLYSCDISKKEETIVAAKILTDRYKPRFTYQNRSELLVPYPQDMAFIDGSHLKDDVIEDINLCLKMNIKYLVFDDILPDFGFAQEAIDTFKDKLELLFENGNIGTYINKSHTVPFLL